MDAAARTSARDKVLFHLKTKGPQSATQLAQRFGVTPMAVRLQLQALVSEGMVSFTDERRKLGRPSPLWSLTPAAARMFPDSHSDLTVELLRAMRTTFGEEGLDRLVGERSRQQRDGYRRRMPGADAPVAARVQALASIRKDEGYMAEWSRDGTGWLLAENHCRICAAAAVCQGFCRDELEIFRDLLGGDVTVVRVEHLLAGARRCAYRIEQAKGTAAGSSAPAGGSEEGPA